MKKLVLLLSVTLFFILNARAQESDSVDFNKILRSSLRGYPFNGNLLIQKNDDVLFQITSGLAIREWNVAHTMDSRFMIASLSKQFTAYAILLLEEEGKLNILDPISKYIKLPRKTKTNAERWHSLTIHDLLTHTAGLIRDIPRTPNVSVADYNHISHITTSTLIHKNVTYKDKGEFTYSNFGYFLLAQIIEKAGVTTYEGFLKRNIFIPLKMRNTGEYHRSLSIQNMSHGYYYNDTRRIHKRCCNDASTYKGSHSLYSTVHDLALWLNELHRESSVLNSNVLDKMKTSQVKVSENEDYGYGLYLTNISEHQVIGHSGHEVGYLSLASYIPETDTMIIYLSNTHSLDDVLDEPSTAIFQRQYLESLD